MPKLLLDENIGAIVLNKLRMGGWNVKSVLEIRPGINDMEVLKLALKEKRILVTLDKDFGKLVFLASKKHVGVIFLRLKEESASNIYKAILHLLLNYSNKIQGRFITVTWNKIRIRPSRRQWPLSPACLSPVA